MFHAFEEHQEAAGFGFTPYNYCLQSLHYQNQILITNVSPPESPAPMVDPTIFPENVIGYNQGNMIQLGPHNANPTIHQENIIGNNGENLIPYGENDAGDNGGNMIRRSPHNVIPTDGQDSIIGNTRYNMIRQGPLNASPSIQRESGIGNYPDNKIGRGPPHNASRIGRWEKAIGNNRDDIIRLGPNNVGHTSPFCMGQQHQFSGPGYAMDGVRLGAFEGGNRGAGSSTTQCQFMPLHGFGGGVCNEQGSSYQQIVGPVNDLRARIAAEKRPMSETSPAVIVAAEAERKHRRKIKNRESAARSRARKEAYTIQLEIDIADLKKENEMLKRKKKAYEEALLQVTVAISNKGKRRTFSATF